MWAYQGIGGGVVPVDKAGEEEADGCAAAEERQGGAFRLCQWADALIASDEGAALGGVVSAILEGPCIEADGEIKAEEIGCGEVEVECAGESVADEEGVVREEVGMNRAARQGVFGRPVLGDEGHVSVYERGEASLQRVGVLRAVFPEASPSLRSQIILAGRCEVLQGEVHACKRSAEGLALGEVWRARAYACEKFHDQRGFAFQRAQGLAVTRGDGAGAGKALAGEVFGQGDEPGQVLRVCAFLKQGEDEAVLRCLQIEVGVLHALGNAFERARLTDVIIGEEGGERFIGNLSVNSHGLAGSGIFLRRPEIVFHGTAEHQEVEGSPEQEEKAD